MLSLVYKPVNNEGAHLLRIQFQNNDYSDKDTNIYKVKTEISGLQDIQKYCKSNQINDIDNIDYIYKKNLTNENNEEIKPYDNKDFNFRVSFQTEKSIIKDTTIDTIKNEWNGTKKSFRYMNRVELVHDTLPLVFHLSIVKSSRKFRNSDKYMYEYTVQKAKVFENYENYEFEMEIDEKKIDEKQSLNDLELTVKKGIKYFYSGIQDSNFPISYKEIDSVLEEYMNVIHDKKIPERHFKDGKLQLYPSDFIGYSSYTLQMQNVIPPNPDIDIPNINNNYTVTEKADGERRLMFISSKGKCYVIDTNLNVQYTGTKTKKDILFNSIIDGEFIKYNKNKELLLLYACFDVYFIGGVDKRKYKFVDKENGKEGRLHLLDKLVKKIELQHAQ